MAVDLGGSEVPLVRGGQGLVRKIPAGTGRKKLRGRNIAGGIDMKFDGNMHCAPNSRTSSRRNIRQDLIQHFTLGNRGGASR